MNRVVLCLGSNCGDRLSYLRQAFRLLKAKSNIRKVSSIYESKAMLPGGAPNDWDKDFLNVGVLVETNLDAAALLQELKLIERDLGRQNQERWAPREIDIDILAFENQTITNERLQIPHVGLTNRPFAILPLVDLWPTWRHPSLNKTALEMASPWIWSTNLPFDTKRTRYSLTETISVLNITPDSFSGDGVLKNSEATFETIQQTIEQHIQNGASVIDVGAESTRPEAQVLTPDEEWRRLEPIFKNVLPEFKDRIKISLDSRNFENVNRALEFKLDWINDVSGFANNQMRQLAKQTQKPIVVMHSLTVPASREIVIEDKENPLEKVLQWGFRKLEELHSEGIENVILDPGIGFGKTPLQNIFLLREAYRFHEWGVPVLIGHSRKSLFNPITPLPTHERDFETALLSARLASDGIEFLRVHSPSLTQRALAQQGFFPGSSNV